MERKFLSKIVADENNKKLGKVIRIEQLPDIITKKLTPHLIILVQKFLRKDVIVKLSIDEIAKVEGNYLWLKMSSKEFQKLSQDAAKLKEYRTEFLANKDYKPPHWAPAKK